MENNNALTTVPQRSITEIDPKIIESIVLNGDISKLEPLQKVQYYNGICQSLGLSPLSQPFQVLKLNGKERLYATRDATDQLRKVYGVSIVEMITETVNEIYIVKVKVQDKDGRYDVATGAVAIKGQSGEALAISIMKAETKAKRRATLSLCGLGMLDELEVENMKPYETTPLQPAQAEKFAAMDIEPAMDALVACATIEELQKVYKGLDKEIAKHPDVVKCKDDMKTSLAAAK